MRKLFRFTPPLLLIAIIIMASIAAAPATLAKPEAPTVSATANGGEVVIAWTAVPGAQYYTVGWVNWTEAEPLSDAGEDWLSLFHYTTVPGDRTSYTVKGLNGGEDYYAIIRATDVAGTRGRFGGGYSPFSAWSPSAAQPAGEHGVGFCPITGLPLGEDGYLGLGDTATFDEYTVTVQRVETPESVTLTSSDGTKTERKAPAGRRWLRIYTRLVNEEDFTVTLTRGNNYVLSTDAGDGFSWSSNRAVESGQQRDASLLFDIPIGATTVVWAVRPYTRYEGGDNAPQLFRLSVPEPPAAKVVFGDLNWESALIQSRVAQYLVEKGYGYPTETRFGTTSALFQSLRSGDVHVLMELWLPNQEEAWTAGLAAGEVYSPGESLGRDWQSAFVIPAYLQERHPGLDHVEDLKDPQYRQLFATAETDGKARLVSCVVGWACERVNAAQIEGYGLAEHVEVVNPSDRAALNADLEAAYERGDPWLGYQWGTNGPALELDVVRLEEPPYSDECWSITMACAYEDATVLIAAGSRLPDIAPEVAAMLVEWDFSVDAIYKEIARWSAANPEAGINDTARWWLEERGDVWEKWVTDEAAAAVSNALAAGELPEGWPDP